MNNEEKNIEEQGTAPESTPKTSWWAKLATGVKAGIIAAAALVVIIPIVLIIALGGNGNTGDGGNGDNGGNNGGSSEISYSVTVKDNEGNPIAGVKVDFILKNGTALTSTTDANGKATPITNKNIASAKIASVPTEYEYSKLGVTQNFAEDGSLSVTVNKLPPYIVKIIDQNGDAVVGAYVMICVSGNEGMCVPLPDATDANGETSIIVPSATYEAKISTLPAGYTVDDMSRYYEMSGNTVTITVTKTAE